MVVGGRTFAGIQLSELPLSIPVFFLLICAETIIPLTNSISRFGFDLGLCIREWQHEEKRMMVADFSLSPVPTPCLLCLPFCLGFWFHRLSLSLLLSPCTHRLSLSLSWCTSKFNRLIYFLFKMRGF